MAIGDLTLAIVGDIHISRPDPASIFAGCASILKEADIAFGNLEGTYTDRGTPLVGKIEVGSRHLRAEPKSIQGFTAAGFDAVSLANNHTMDWGPEGILQTVELLDKMGIAHCGAGRNLADAHKPAIVERNGTRVAFLSYTSVFIAGFPAGKDTAGCATVWADTAYIPPPNIMYQPGFPPLTRTFPNPKDMELMLDDVRKAKSQADIVIVAWHWGVSHGYGRPAEYQKVAARAALDAGADLIAGHHPHMLHGMEFYKDKLICYSLGNFAFDIERRPHFGMETLILKCYVKNKRIQKIAFVPCLINDQSQPIVLQGKDAQQVIKVMEERSADFNMAFTPEGNEVVVGPGKAKAKAEEVQPSWLYEATGFRPRG